MLVCLHKALHVNVVVIIFALALLHVFPVVARIIDHHPLILVAESGEFLLVSFFVVARRRLHQELGLAHGVLGRSQAAGYFLRLDPERHRRAATNLPLDRHLLATEQSLHHRFGRDTFLVRTDRTKLVP